MDISMTLGTRGRELEQLKSQLTNVLLGIIIILIILTIIGP